MKIVIINVLWWVVKGLVATTSSSLFGAGAFTYIILLIGSDGGALLNYFCMIRVWLIENLYCLNDGLWYIIIYCLIDINIRHMVTFVISPSPRWQLLYRLKHKAGYPRLTYVTKDLPSLQVGPLWSRLVLPATFFCGIYSNNAWNVHLRERYDQAHPFNMNSLEQKLSFCV